MIENVYPVHGDGDGTDVLGLMCKSSQLLLRN